MLGPDFKNHFWIRLRIKVGHTAVRLTLGQHLKDSEVSGSSSSQQEGKNVCASSNQIHRQDTRACMTMQWLKMLAET